MKYQFILCNTLNILLMLLVIFSSPRLNAQEETHEKSTYVFGAIIGFNNIHIKDEYISPEIISGTIFNSEILLAIKRKNSKHLLNLSFGKGPLSTKDSRNEISQHVGSIEYSYLHLISVQDIGGNPLEFYCGGGLSSYVLNTDFNTVSAYGLGKNYDQSWYWSHSLNFLAQCNYLISTDQSLSLQIMLPLYKIISRPANGHWLDNRNQEVMHDSFLNSAFQGKPEFAWDNFSVFGLINYSKKIDDTIDLQFSYKFTYLSAKVPLTVKSFSNNFSIGLNFIL